MDLGGRATDSQVRKLGQEGPLGTEVTARGSIDTLGASDVGDTQPCVVKAVSGGGATALPRSTRRNLRELKTQEGIEMHAGLNHLRRIEDHEPEQRPEADATFAGAGQPAGGAANGAREAVTDEVMRLERGTKPLEREP